MLRFAPLFLLSACALGGAELTVADPAERVDDGGEDADAACVELFDSCYALGVSARTCATVLDECLDAAAGEVRDEGEEAPREGEEAPRDEEEAPRDGDAGTGEEEAPRDVPADTADTGRP